MKKRIDVNTYDGTSSYEVELKLHDDAKTDADNIELIWNEVEDMTIENVLRILKGQNVVYHREDGSTIPAREAVRYLEHGPKMVEFIRSIVLGKISDCDKWEEADKILSEMGL